MEFWHRLSLEDEDEDELILGFLKMNFVEDEDGYIKIKDCLELFRLNNSNIIQEYTMNTQEHKP